MSGTSQLGGAVCSISASATSDELGDGLGRATRVEGDSGKVLLLVGTDLVGLRLHLGHDVDRSVESEGGSEY